MDQSMLIVLGLILAAVAFLALKGGGDSKPASNPPHPDNLMDPANWSVTTMDEDVQPYATPDGWALDIPLKGESRHYVTVPSGPLTGKTIMRLKGRWEMDPGVKLVPRRFPDAPSLMTLYFQRNGDDWTAQGPFEAYRWYASFGTVQDIKPGEFVMTARFDQNWTAILTSSRETNQDGFNVAINDAGRIGFVLGGGDGLGHGVYATGSARLVVTSFIIE